VKECDGCGSGDDLGRHDRAKHEDAIPSGRGLHLVRGLRRDGGKPQVFCRPPGRRAFDAAGRRSVAAVAHEATAPAQ